jgi:AcrR family transcriptional regulator
VTAAPATAATTSDLPLRQVGTRTRSGNAMLRTRTAIVDAAALCIERVGVRRTTMSEVAEAAGIAKATLYNHFRTKGDVLAALVDLRIAAVAARCCALGGAASAGASGGPLSADAGAGAVPTGQAPNDGTVLAAVLSRAATGVADCGPLRRVAAEEPTLLLPLLAPGAGRGWDRTRAAVGHVLVAAGTEATPELVDVVLRWLVGQLLWPLAPGQVAAEVRLLVHGLVGDPPGSPDPPAR